MPSMSGGALRHVSNVHELFDSGFVSMPSMSGGALRRSRRLPGARGAVGFYALDVGRGLCDSPSTRTSCTTESLRFLCPRCRAGLCDSFATKWSTHYKGWVSMPSMSGVVLRRAIHWWVFDVWQAILCPRCRAGLFEESERLIERACRWLFLCPRCRARRRRV